MMTLQNIAHCAPVMQAYIVSNACLDKRCTFMRHSLIKEKGLLTMPTTIEDVQPHIDMINALIEGQNVEGHICSGREMIWKRKNLFEIAKKCTRMLEIGFNAGHSAAHLLVANPDLELYCFDLCYHTYTPTCFEYLKSVFGDRIKLISGDSSKTIPAFIAEHNFDISFDGFHIDGCHDPMIAREDIYWCHHLAQKDAWVVFDDTDYAPLFELWKETLEIGDVYLIDLYDNGLFPTLKWSHGIGRYVGIIPHFDWKWYVQTNPDLPANGIITEAKARTHWIQYGRKERRQPNNKAFGLSPRVVETTTSTPVEMP